jgi:hypothetical protein
MTSVGEVTAEEGEREKMFFAAQLARNSPLSLDKGVSRPLDRTPRTFVATGL